MSLYKKGQITKATISGIENYGAFVTLNDGYSGLIHISEISYNFVKNINNYFKVGDIIFVEIIDVDNVEKKLKLSIKNITYNKKKCYIKKRIIETPSGFKTLNEILPIWIEKKLISIKNEQK